MGDVIDFNKARAKEQEQIENEVTSYADKASPETDFESIAKANKAKQERLKKERQQHNRKVTKSYRLK